MMHSLLQRFKVFQKGNKLSLDNCQIVMSFDDNYVWPFLVTVYSAYINSRELNEITILVDYETVSSENLGTVKQVLFSMGIELNEISISLPFNIQQNGHISRNSFAKLFFLQTKPAKFVWLDCDLLCLPGWEEILLMDSEEGLIARKHWDSTSLNKSNTSVIISNGLYFNSGVMVVFPKKLKSILTLKILKELILNYNQLGFQWSDQCILNYVVKGKYDFLDSGFNSTPDEYKSGVSKILHFAGSEKPFEAVEYKTSLEKAISYRFTSRDNAFWEYFYYERLLAEYLSKHEIELPSNFRKFSKA